MFLSLVWILRTFPMLLLPVRCWSWKVFINFVTSIFGSQIVSRMRSVTVVLPREHRRQWS